MLTLFANSTVVALFCWVLTSSVEASTIAEGACTSFQWITDVDGTEKSAMVVSATVNGHPTTLQFDTGSDVSMLYGVQQAEMLDLKVTERNSTQKIAQGSLHIGNIDLALQNFFITSYPPAQVAGRIGLKSLLGKIVQIDYPNTQICLLNPVEYLESRLHSQQISAQVRSNKLFLDAGINQDFEQQLFFDTGASLYSLLVDKPMWQQLTGRKGNEKDNMEIQGWANDVIVTTVGAPMQGDIQLGELTLTAPLVHYTRERPSYFAKSPISTNGLLGNALFFDRKIIMDLREYYTSFSIFDR